MPFHIEELTKVWEIIGLDYVLSELLKAHKEEKNKYIAQSYDDIICDCLLALNKYEDFLDRSNPRHICHINSLGFIDLRLSVQKMLGKDANPLDVYRTHFPTQSKIVKSNPKSFEKHIINVFNSYASDKGGWFKIFESRNIGSLKVWSYTGSFKSVRLWGKKVPYFNVQVANYSNVAMKELHSTIKTLTTQAENLVRAEYGLSPIEVSWRTEKLLYRRLKNEFPNTQVILHGKPSWLGKQHFDIWIPEWNIAVEYQGIYHFEPVNGQEELEKAIERDKRKMDLASKYGVKLFLETSSDNDELVSEIRKSIHDI